MRREAWGPAVALVAFGALVLSVTGGWWWHYLTGSTMQVRVLSCSMPDPPRTYPPKLACSGAPAEQRDKEALRSTLDCRVANDCVGRPNGAETWSGGMVVHGADRDDVGHTVTAVIQEDYNRSPDLRGKVLAGYDAYAPTLSDLVAPPLSAIAVIGGLVWMGAILRRARGREHQRDDIRGLPEHHAT